MPGQIRAVLFDAVGTLIHPDPSVARAYAAAGARCGSRLTEGDISPRFKTAFARSELSDCDGALYATSEAHERRRWRQIVEEVLSDVPQPEAAFASLWQHFADVAHWRLFDDAPQAWQALESRGLLLGIASNFDSRLFGICRGLPPLDRCEHVFVSSDVGWRKPGREFFRAIERRLSLQPEELLLIGDDPRNDHVGATEAGWQSLLIDHHGRQPGCPANLTEAVNQIEFSGRNSEQKRTK